MCLNEQVVITMSASPAAAPPRALTCEHCGTAFTCSGDLGCWCAAEPYRLPMPGAGTSADCLCPDCLRAAAAKSAATAASAG